MDNTEESALGRWDRAKRWLRPRLAWLTAAIAFGGAIILIVVQLRGESESPDTTTLGLFALAVGLGFAFFAPGPTVDALRRVSRFKVGSVELGLAEIKRAERVRPPQEDDGVSATPRKGRGYEMCVDRLKSSLQYVREMLGLDAGKRDHIGIAEELRLKKLLTRDQETFVLDLLKNYDPISDDWSTATEQEFLDATWLFVMRFRALVWDRRVRQQLEQDRWFIADYEQKTGHRPDFLAHRDNRWALIAARVGSRKEDKPDKLDVAAKRLAEFSSNPASEEPDIAARSIVMPDISRGYFSAKLPQAVRDKVTLLNLTEIAGDNWRRAIGG